MGIPIPVKNKVFLTQRAMYALGDYESINKCFRRVFAESNFLPQIEDEAKIVYYPGGVLDRVGSALGNTGVSNHRSSQGYTFDKFMEADIFSVRFLSSGNPLVTGIMLKVSLKLRWLNEGKQKTKAENFLKLVSRMTKEYNIHFIDYDNWKEFVAQNGQYKAICQWDSAFLFSACPKHKEEYLKHIGRIPS